MKDLLGVSHFTVPHAAAIIGVDPNTLRTRIKRGTLAFELKTFTAPNGRQVTIKLIPAAVVAEEHKRKMAQRDQRS